MPECSRQKQLLTGHQCCCAVPEWAAARAAKLKCWTGGSAQSLINHIPSADYVQASCGAKLSPTVHVLRISVLLWQLNRENHYYLDQLVYVDGSLLERYILEDDRR
jgi:hypothetical protein